MAFNPRRPGGKVKDIIVIKEASIEDVVKVNSTVVEMDKSYPKEHFKERYDGKSHLVIVAYINQQPVGYIVGYDKFGDGSFYCWMAGVDPKYRRCGVLKALMDYENKWAKQHGYNKIKIKTRNDKRAMLAYLVKYGFNFTEVEAYPSIKDNRIQLEKNL